MTGGSHQVHPLRRELDRRMTRPQRHRLLQGYPMAPVMQPARRGYDPLRAGPLDRSRPLIIGILPHTFCNPRVRGCGFCTFPHEKFERGAIRKVTDRVAREIEHLSLRAPGLCGRQVEAVYFGGGTANLTPPAELNRLCAALASTFDLAGAELTLEGVPRYFRLRDEGLLDVLAATGVRHRRISMGVQTFDAAWLHRMGRDELGDRDEIEQVVASAHRRDFTTSADLLFNLPGTGAAHALADVATAIAIGFDQICVYNLVLAPELETEWAHDRSLVQAMRAPADACAIWLAVRGYLLDHGYVQTTLTNFERAEVAASPRRFVYERASFDPADRDCLGFGPGAISTVTRPDHQSASKWMNEPESGAFVAAIDRHDIATARAFEYAGVDLQLLHLTRGLSRITIDRAAYAAWFGEDPAASFALHLDALEETQLVRCDSQAITLTPTGMFYADAVAGLLAHNRIIELRRSDREAIRDHMG